MSVETKCTDAQNNETPCVIENRSRVEIENGVESKIDTAILNLNLILTVTSKVFESFENLNRNGC